MKVEKYVSVSPSTRCQNCQGYGHLPSRCRGVLACPLCAEKHLLKDHACKHCQVTGLACKHLILKCSNCQGPHKATDAICEVRKALFKTTL